MSRKIITVLDGPDAQVQIVRRPDGTFAFRVRDRYPDGWSDPGPDLGIYDSAETAESEARERVSWLRTIH